MRLKYLLMATVLGILLCAGCDEPDCVTLDFDSEFVNLVLGDQVDEVELTRGNDRTMIITGQAKPTSDVKTPPTFLVQVPKMRVAALRRFLDENAVAYSSPLGPMDTKAFVISFFVIVVLLATTVTLILWRGRAAWGKAKELWTKRELVTQAMKDLLEGVWEVIKMPMFSADEAYDVWLLCLETLERFAIASAVSLGLLLMAYRFSGALKPAIVPLLAGTIRVPADVFFRTAQLTLKLSLAALICSLAAGALSKLLFLTRYVLKPLRTSGRFIMFGLPVIIFSALLIKKMVPPASAGFAFVLAITPTAALFPSCFELAGVVVPDLGQVWSHVRECIGVFRGRDPGDEFGSGTGGAKSDDEEKHSGQKQQEERKAEAPSPPTERAAHAALLGVSETASFKEIRGAFLSLAKQYHPDHVQHLGPKLRDAAEREMKAINQAYNYFEHHH